MKHCGTEAGHLAAYRRWQHQQHHTMDHKQDGKNQLRHPD